MRPTHRPSQLLLSAVLCAGFPQAWASPSPGAAQSLAVLGASTVTNTGASTLWGDLGVSAGSSIAGPSPSARLSGQDLGSVGVLTAGIHRFDDAAQLTGTRVLDAQGDANAWLGIQIGSALTLAGSAAVQVINGDSNTGPHWDVGRSATPGSGSLFAGNIVASQSITLKATAKILCGGALALQGHSFVLVQAARSEQPDRATDAARQLHDTGAQRYGRLVIEQLLPVGSTQQQVAESPDRGLGLQRPTHPDGQRG